MGYKSLIQGSVKKAFRLVGDLAVNTSFIHKTDTGFDFTTNAVKTPVSTTKPVKAIFVQKAKNSEGKIGRSVQSSFLFDAADVNDASSYDSIVVAVGLPAAIGTWKIVPPIENDGYLMTINCAKEQNG